MRILTAAFICLISLSVAAKTYTADEVVLKDKLFYDKDNKLITGEIVKNYPNGAKFAHFTVKDGVSEKSELYYPNGKLKNQESKDSRIEYWPNTHIRRESRGDREKGNDVRKFYTGSGDLLIEAPFKNNLIDGVVKIYTDKNVLQEERPYHVIVVKNGDKSVNTSVLHGKSNLFGADKKVIATTDYDNGVVKKITHFDANGNALPTVVNNEVGAFDSNTCQIDGKAFTGALIINAVNPQTQFFEVPCQNGVIDGIVRVYLGSYGTYGRIYDNIPYKNGKKDGVARVYSYADLLLSGEVPYQNDQVQGTVYEYLESGEMYYETPYKDNQIDGVRKIYGSAFITPAGDVLMAEIPYTKGQKNGIATLYTPTGDVQKKITYLFDKEVYTKDYDKKESVGSNSSSKAN